MINIHYTDRMNRSRSSRETQVAGALPSLRQLRYLVVLAEKLNFREAAEACFVTQSTLSAGIKELESQLDAHLVERDRKSVRLTPLGEQVVERARRLLAEAGDLVTAARAAREPLSGDFRLGVIPTIAPFLLPAAVPSLRERFPALRLYLREDLTERLLEQLRAGQLDAALLALPFDTGDLELRVLFRDEFWFVARADDPLAKRKAIAVERLDVNDVEPFHSDGLALCERIVGAGDEPELVAEQHAQLEVAGVEGQREQRGVELARAKLLEQPLGEAFAQVQPQSREALAQRRHRRREQERRDRGDDAEAEVSGERVARGPRRRNEVARFGEQSPRALDQLLAERREPDAPLVALDQVGVELGLELLDPRRQRRLGDE